MCGMLIRSRKNIAYLGLRKLPTRIQRLGGLMRVTFITVLIHIYSYSYSLSLFCYNSKSNNSRQAPTNRKEDLEIYQRILWVQKGIHTIEKEIFHRNKGKNKHQHHYNSFINSNFIHSFFKKDDTTRI